MSDALAFTGFVVLCFGLVAVLRPLPVVGLSTRLRGLAAFLGGFILLGVGSTLGETRDMGGSAKAPPVFLDTD